MEKIKILLLLFALITNLLVYDKAQAADYICNKKSGFTVYDETTKACINPTENLRAEGGFLKVNSIELTCNKNAGYTQIKDNKCYNPTTKLSYDIGYTFASHKKSKTTYKEYYVFFLDDNRCGKNCDYDGKNCESGICNIDNCARYAGYTQIKNETCYNPKTKMGYSLDGAFYRENTNGYWGSCGKNCDIYGRNCKEGGCHPLRCSKGFQSTTNTWGKYICYNPKTLLAYDKNLLFTHDEFVCGEKCDVNGRNCQKGVCNVKDCLPGYTKFNKSYCVNPSTGFVYRYNTDEKSEEEFSFYFPTYVAINGVTEYNFNPTSSKRDAICDKNGANCKSLKQPCSISGGDCTIWDDIVLLGGFGLLAVGAVVTAPIYLPYIWITDAIPDKQAEIIVDYVEKNRFRKNNDNKY